MEMSFILGRRVVTSLLPEVIRAAFAVCARISFDVPVSS